MSQAFIDFLNQELAQRQKKNQQYSLRAFARSLNVSPAQLSQVLSKKRKLSLPVIERISQKLALSPLEKEQILNAWSKEQIQQGSAELFKKRLLQDDEFKLISDWHHFAILSLCSAKNSSTDPHWISERLEITGAQAKEAVARLQRLNILGPGPKLKQISPPLAVISQVSSEAIQRYHQQILNLASEKIQSVPVELRDYSAMTMPVKVSNLKKYRDLIEKFQDDLLLLSKGSDDSEVYIFSCQLFPIQRSKSKEGKKNGNS